MRRQLGGNAPDGKAAADRDDQDGNEMDAGRDDAEGGAEDYKQELDLGVHHAVSRKLRRAICKAHIIS